MTDKSQTKNNQKKGGKKRRFPPAFCLVCGHSWEPRSEKPKQCPKCQSRRWNKPPEPAAEPTEIQAEQPSDVLLVTDDALYEVEEVETEDALEITSVAAEHPPEVEEPEEQTTEEAEPEPALPVEVHIIEIEDSPPEQVEATVESIASPEPLPPAPRLDPRSEMERLEEPRQRGRLVGILRRMSERPSRDAGRRTKISEDRPELYRLAAVMLPKAPILILLLVLAWSALSSMAAGNMWFVLDWYRATWILPQLVGIFTYPAGPGEWFVDYWPLVVLGVMLLVSVLIFTWSLPWRYAFKDYIMVDGQNKHKDGRVMWSDCNVWTRTWDRYYGTEPRTTVTLWLKDRFWWNPLMPSKGLLRLTLDKEIERPHYEGPFAFTAHERRYRMYTGYRQMVTTDDGQQAIEIPLDMVNMNFRERGRRLVKDTQRFSLANPNVRLEKLRHSTHIVPDKLKEAAEIARARRGE